MDESIKAELYKGDDLLDTYTYSVNKYLDDALTGSDAKTEALINATKQYGKAAANYFKNKNNVLSFGAIAEKDYRNFAPTLNGAKLSLVLENETSIRLYIEGVAAGATASGYTSKASSADKANAGYPSYFEIPNLTPGMLGKEFMLTLNSTDYKFSALSWVNLILGDESSSDKNIYMAKAVFEYYKAARAFSAPVYNIVDLSELTQNYNANDGDVLTGTLSGNYKVSVANGANITLRDVTINGTNDSEWAGITCGGDATLTLEGENKVKGFKRDYPGIYIAEDKTLTINGTGSLDASSNGYGAGIGGGNNISSCGNIKIESGNITATGGYDAAGIGAGSDQSTCGHITISGGTVTAIKGENAHNSIGEGNGVVYDAVTIGGVVGAISQSPYIYSSNN